MQQSNYKEERTDLIIGIITSIVILALFVWMVASIGHNVAQTRANNLVGEITALGETRRGTEQVFTYNPDHSDIIEGASVYWTVNGETVYHGAYVSGQDITLNYTPEQSGTLEIVAGVGNYKQTTTVEVLGPRLTLTAPNVTVTYGTSMPEINCRVDGLLSVDDTSDFCYDGKCVVDCDKLDVGVYDVKMQECSYRDYETEYVYGKLTVLPKQLTVTNTFSKVYDATNTIDNPDISLDGVIEGDEVCAKCDKLYFDNKNVGTDKTIMLANVCLEGADACNYILPDYVSGRILPRTVRLVGLTVKDKAYDGTTKATIDKMGTLSGVVKGDSVAIGNVNVSFADANVGKQQVTTSKVTLIGADKDNYTVVIDNPTAEISDGTSFWDKLLDREPVAQGRTR